MPADRALRIVQLTDCHLFSDRAGELLGVATRPRLEAVLRDLRERSPEFDLLVVTGDTAHDEARPTYEAFRESLGDWVARLRIVPGNHDNRELLRTVFPNSGGGASGRIGFHANLAGWQVIGLDSQITGETSGELGDEQLGWLESLLETPTAPNALLFMHHPPIEIGSRWLDEVRLRDAAELERVIQVHPHVSVVFCGHVHQEASGSVAGADVHTTPAVGPQLRPRAALLELDAGPPGYRVIDLHPDGRWSTDVVRLEGA